MWINQKELNILIATAVMDYIHSPPFMDTLENRVANRVEDRLNRQAKRAVNDYLAQEIILDNIIMRIKDKQL